MDALHARASICSWSRAAIGLGVAQEAALKLKETCGLHAEAFSSAEVKHGPMALVRAGFPVLMLTQDDETRAGIEALAAEFAARGATVLLAGARRARRHRAADRHGASRASSRMLAIQSFYAMANDAEPGTRTRSGPPAASSQGDRDRLMLLAFTQREDPHRRRPRAGAHGAGARWPHRGRAWARAKSWARTVSSTCAARCWCRASSTARSTAAAACCSTTIPRRQRSRRSASAHRRFGTTGFLPTLISDDLDVVARAIDAVRDAIARGVPGVLGIHIEGPVPQRRRGAASTTPSKLRALDGEAVELLMRAAWRRHHGDARAGAHHAGVHPRSCRDAGVIVSAGHTNATFDELQPALRAGLRGFTHLFNAMSPLGSRDPGAVGAALADADSWCGLIVDGHHVHPEV